MACPVRPQCTTSATRPRALALLPTRELHEVQTHNRLAQTTEEWQRHYAIRAGIEATLSQNVRAHGLRRSRYRGLKRTHVQHVLTALACNIARVTDWLDAELRTPSDHSLPHPVLSRHMTPSTSPTESCRCFTWLRVGAVGRGLLGCQRKWVGARCGVRPV
ncbi:transposase [Streptomyces mirabilis]|uniref:transposase n=1 Tax=Streptomyces mirabilis TaxID=68239 RepID=UPI00332DDB6D